MTDPEIDAYRARVLLATLRELARRGMDEAAAEVAEAEANAHDALERLISARDNLVEWTARGERVLRIIAKHE